MWCDKGLTQQFRDSNEPALSKTSVHQPAEGKERFYVCQKKTKKTIYYFKKYDGELILLNLTMLGVWHLHSETDTSSNPV